MTKEIDYVELLKLAHEQLSSQSDMIELLDSKLTGLECRLCDLVFAILSIEHEQGGSLGADGQFYYKVPESIFNKAKAIKEQGND